MRLDKFLAESSIGTRKKVRNYIKDGCVKVNGNLIIEPAFEIDEKNDIIKYLDCRVEHKGKVYYMFNKPQGCITARTDAENKTVFDYFKDSDMSGVFHVGRLDKDTEGLLLFTNDGDFNHALMSPENHVEKKYFFIALGELDGEKISKLADGISIGQKEEIIKSAGIEVLKSGLYEDLEDELGLRNYYDANAKFYKQNVTAGYITISEGCKHQVKRMIKAVGCYVIYLKRVSIGKVALDENLEKGQYRKLTDDEISKLIGNKLKKQ